jgi:hypothetical protein
MTMFDQIPTSVRKEEEGTRESKQPLDSVEHTDGKSSQENLETAKIYGGVKVSS